MKITTMRRLDRWFGVPICALLSGLRKLLAPWRPNGTETVRRALVVKLAEQGSTVLAYPALQHLADRVGRDNLFALVFAENRFILDALEIIPPDHVITIDATNLWRFTCSTLKALRTIRAAAIDTAFDFEFFSRATAILTLLSGARNRIGLHAAPGEGGYRGDLMTHRIHFNPNLHTTDLFLAMACAPEQARGDLPALSMAPKPAEDLPQAEFALRPEHERGARQILTTKYGGDPGRPLVLLNANCSDMLPLRRWDSDRYVELARGILDRWPTASVAFTGDPGEAPAAAQLVQTVGNPRRVSLAGHTSLTELLAIYHLADILVTNDSGPAHFASLTPIQVITLFGPETPHLFAARTPRSHVLWAGLACSPCVNAFNGRYSACRDNQCMQHIAVAAVMDRISRIAADAQLTASPG